MKFWSFLKMVVLFGCLLGFAAVSWANDTVPASQDAQGVVGEEAIVANIDNDKVTLRSSGDATREFTVSSADAANLKVGDKVKVQGNNVSKLDAIPGASGRPAKEQKP